MRNFCTLFDLAYLPKGLCLYESLLRHAGDFVLYILPMDNECANRLLRMHLPHVQLVLGFHETHPGMKEARENRTHAEYCWTSSSNFLEALMATGLDECTYLDSDMLFFSDPQAAFDEIGKRSIAIVPHRFIKSKQYLEVNGKYNVSWVTFRNTPVGIECLKRWARQCRDRCSAVIGCGDQKYLDEFIPLFGKDVCSFVHPGIGLAPWNLARYVLSEGPRVDAWDVVFFHFHEMQERPDGTFRLTNYALRDEDREYIYEPYLHAYKKAKALSQEIRL